MIDQIFYLYIKISPYLQVGIYGIFGLMLFLSVINEIGYSSATPEKKLQNLKFQKSGRSMIRLSVKMLVIGLLLTPVANVIDRELRIKMLDPVASVFGASASRDSVKYAKGWFRLLIIEKPFTF